MDLSLSPQFETRVEGAFGAAGREWLRNLPDLLEQICADWELRPNPPFPDLNYNYVCPVRRADGSEMVLKLGTPQRELFSEINALRSFDGRGAVRLLAADAERGALLLERLRPGGSLVDSEDDEAATEIACRVMAELQHIADWEGNFPTVEDWGLGFERYQAEYPHGDGPLPTELVQRARTTHNELCASSVQPRLLHGDLHHGNILAAQRQPWLAVDPKGLIGEPTYDCGAWLRNPIPRIWDWGDLAAITLRRADQMAERLGFERELILAWAFAQTMPSVIWSIEGGDPDWRQQLAMAEIFAKVAD